MPLLVLNAGSSSVKYTLFDAQAERVLANGLADRVGVGGGASAVLSHSVSGGQRVSIERPLPTHEAAVALILDTLIGPDGPLPSVSQIVAVGHRVVHGGPFYAASVRITADVIAAIEACAAFSPLHNPPSLAGIRACAARMGETPQVAVFDTAFGRTLPPEASQYALPYELSLRHGLRRYGFHGTSHRSVAGAAARILTERGVAAADQKIISCHLGNGCSMTAVSGGRCVETSMGLTPLEGLVMGTRSGDVDPAVVSFLAEREGLDAAGVVRLLNQESGLLGVSGVGSDMRDVLAAAARGDRRARLARDMYVHRIRKYLGAYYAVLGGLHALVFTAGVGENSAEIRALCLRGLEPLGLVLDAARNEATAGRQDPADIAAAGSPARILVIPANEERLIARDTLEVVRGARPAAP